ncbi:hypothetical protein Fot_31927 [Forsythia ovata]|uniref:Uncharacterized protein n=1 Tax=Forsythia ovata TaxID=205694 RepID=A0ABD1T6R5_9LAMI
MSLLVRLVRMKTREDLKGMLNGIGSSNVVKVYIVSPTQTFALPWDLPTVKWRSNVIIKEILESKTIREPRSEKVIKPESQSFHGNEPSVEIQSQDDRCYML